MKGFKNPFCIRGSCRFIIGIAMERELMQVLLGAEENRDIPFEFQEWSAQRHRICIWGMDILR